MLNKSQFLFSFSVIFIIGLIFYSVFLPDFSFNDHEVFLQHMPLFNKPLDWLSFCYSYTRENFYPGDTFLFHQLLI